jgi:hypothetical protein
LSRQVLSENRNNTAQTEKKVFFATEITEKHGRNQEKQKSNCDIIFWYHF